jgi:hypothetical protein
VQVVPAFGNPGESGKLAVCDSFLVNQMGLVDADHVMSALGLGERQFCSFEV